MGAAVWRGRGGAGAGTPSRRHAAQPAATRMQPPCLQGEIQGPALSLHQVPRAQAITWPPRQNDLRASSGGDGQGVRWAVGGLFGSASFSSLPTALSSPLLVPHLLGVEAHIVVHVLARLVGLLPAAGSGGGAGRGRERGANVGGGAHVGRHRARRRRRRTRALAEQGRAAAGARSRRGKHPPQLALPRIGARPRAALGPGGAGAGAPPRPRAPGPARHPATIAKSRLPIATGPQRPRTPSITCSWSPTIPPTTPRPVRALAVVAIAGQGEAQAQGQGQQLERGAHGGAWGGVVAGEPGTDVGGTGNPIGVLQTAGRRQLGAAECGRSWERTPQGQHASSDSSHGRPAAPTASLAPP